MERSLQLQITHCRPRTISTPPPHSKPSHIRPPFPYQPPNPRPTILSPDVNTKPQVNNYNKTKNKRTHDSNNNNNNPVEDEANTTYARRTKAKAKHQGRQQLRSKWESKALHGKYPQRVKQADMDQDKTQRWLKRGLYNRSPGSKPSNTLVPSQHPQEP